MGVKPQHIATIAVLGMGAILIFFSFKYAHDEKMKCLDIEMKKLESKPELPMPEEIPIYEEGPLKEKDILSLSDAYNSTKQKIFGSEPPAKKAHKRKW